MFRQLLSLVLISFAFSLQLSGVDVSKYQGTNINWSTVKNSGISFAILRAGYGTGNEDPTYELNYKGAKAAGVYVGVYWYSYALKGTDGATEANSLLPFLQNKQFEYPIYYDIEEASIFTSGITNDIAKGFCTVMEAHKFFCGIYSSTNTFNYYFDADVKSRYSLWVAQWYSHCTYEGPYGIWQYGLSSVPGITGDVDSDYSYIDFPTIMKEAHLNGY